MPRPRQRGQASGVSGSLVLKGAVPDNQRMSMVLTVEMSIPYFDSVVLPV